MRIAVEGCAHGELENIYSTISEIEQKENIKVDLLICCGDFQSSRNEDDLTCMAVPPKYRHICTFYKYYNGEKKAPILTIFIGGNHEASNYLQELPYGGWVAPNIFYLGYAGVINIAGLRIGGLSGIYKGNDYLKGRFEKCPYNESTKRSVYHVRNLEVFRLKQISQPVDIFLSHDWPVGIYNHGNIGQLLKKKPFFKDEVESNQLGSRPCQELLNHLKPNYWFSAHLHCKFAALVPHENDSFTKFLALDKCLPRRKFLQIVNIEHDETQGVQIKYDLEWLAILRLTNHLLSVKSTVTYMPGPGSTERFDFTPSEEEKNLVFQKLNGILKVPKNFVQTAQGYSVGNKTHSRQPSIKLNPQTVELCKILGIDDPICLISESAGLNLSLDSSFKDSKSFISDSDNSCSDSESKLNESDNSSIQEKIKELKLPEPKYNQEKSSENEIDDKNDGLKVCEESPEKLSPKRVLDSEENEVSEEKSVIKDDNTPKKFKRRNAEIYNSEEIKS